MINSMDIVLKTLAFVNNDGDFSLETSRRYNVLQVLSDEIVRENVIQPLLSSFPLPRNIPDEYQREVTISVCLKFKLGDFLLSFQNFSHLFIVNFFTLRYYRR